MADSVGEVAQSACIQSLEPGHQCDCQTRGTDPGVLNKLQYEHTGSDFDKPHFTDI